MSEAAKPSSISISIEDVEIVLSEAPASAGSVKLEPMPEPMPVKPGKFAFEFEGLITDDFTVKKYNVTSGKKRVTEIWLKRGLGELAENIPLVRIVQP